MAGRMTFEEFAAVCRIVLGRAPLDWEAAELEVVVDYLASSGEFPAAPVGEAELAELGPEGSPFRDAVLDRRNRRGGHGGGQEGNWSRLVVPDPVPAQGAGSERPDVAVAAGTRLDGAGRFHLLEPIGRGGLGQVWRAEQTVPVTRTVAVKLIRSDRNSEALAARFKTEVQVQARMTHPNIARVYDAGSTTDGHPYLVMELIEGGLFVTDYCDRRRAGLRSRLELFVIACRALHHAHLKGIIHCDVKPSNVLVGACDGAPVLKVIDFGVARVLGEAAGVGEVSGTPGYMSPEQAVPNGSVDIRSDVYGLGALLYELLVGRPPVRCDPHPDHPVPPGACVPDCDPPAGRYATLTGDGRREVAENRETDPARLARVLSGELRWAVTKALACEPAERYQSAEALAADIERYLNDRPLEAAPPSVLYRIRKWVRRNRRILAPTLLCAAFALPVVGYAVQEYRAKARAQFVDALPDRVDTVLNQELPERATGLATVGAELDSAARNPRERTWVVLVDLMIGITHQFRGDAGAARDHFTAAIVSLENRHEPDPQQRAVRRLLLHLAYASRAVSHEALAHTALPVETTLAADRMPGPSVVRSGAANFARAYADLDRAGALRATDVWVATAPGTEKTLAAAAAARGLVLSRTRFYLIKGLHERGEWNAALEVAELLHACETLLAGETHYDVACVFAVAYGRTGNAAHADAAVAHLRKAQTLGFRIDPLQALTATISGRLADQLARDRDVDSLRNYGPFLDFARELADGPKER